MVDLRDSETTTTDEHAILEKVLGVRSGYNPGRDRRLPGHASTSISGAPQSRMFIQEQHDRKIGKVVAYSNNQFDAIYSALEAANIRVPSFKKLEAQDFEDVDEDDDDSNEDYEEEDEE